MDRKKASSFPSSRLGAVLTAVILVKSTREALTNLGPKLADVPGVSEAV